MIEFLESAFGTDNLCRFLLVQILDSLFILACLYCAGCVWEFLKSIKIK